jgi:ABC-type sugar transport system ATPase subunit
MRRALLAGASSALTVGIRAGALRVRPRDGDLALAGRVELAEISGSDTFVHVDSRIGPLVAQLTGVHTFSLGEAGHAAPRSAARLCLRPDRRAAAGAALR